MKFMLSQALLASRMESVMATVTRRMLHDVSNLYENGCDDLLTAPTATRRAKKAALDNASECEIVNIIEIRLTWAVWMSKKRSREDVLPAR